MPAFKHHLRQKNIHVPHAALQLAHEIAYPDLDVKHGLTQIEQLAEEASPFIDASAPIKEQVAGLSHFLFYKRQFRGNHTDYSDPRNSFLNEVLERGWGIPISLSVLFVAVAELWEMPAFPISLPGHFIVGIHDAHDNLLFLDPFHQGKWLSYEDCQKLVAITTGHRGKLRPEWLQPAPPRDILLRMLNNLRIIYLQRNDWEHALRVIECMRYLMPDHPEHLRDMGLIHYHNGSMPQAAHYLNRYLEAKPDASDANAIRRNVSKALQAWGRLN
jgi:regulator of sirC expression with transglutaminase-like and TPR domain